MDEHRQGVAMNGARAESTSEQGWGKDGTKWADGIDWHDVEQVRKAIAKAEGLTP